jgi:hypothetical protein
MWQALASGKRKLWNLRSKNQTLIPILSQKVRNNSDIQPPTAMLAPHLDKRNPTNRHPTQCLTV